MGTTLRRSGGLTFIIVFIQSVALAQWSSSVQLSPKTMTASLNEDMATCLAASGDTLHVVWSGRRASGSAVYYKRSIDMGISWSIETPITDTTGSAAFPAIAASGSIVHVVWMDSLLGHRASFYKHYLNEENGWGPTVILDSNTSFWPGLSASGSMVVVSLNKTIASGNTEVFLRRSIDNGATWEPEQQISNAAGRSEDPAIAALSSHIHLVWNDKRTGVMQTYYCQSLDAGATWGPETALISGGGAQGSYSTMVSLDGANVDVVSGDSRNGNFDVFIRQSSDVGTSWDTARQLTTSSVPEAYPYLVRDGQNLHLGYWQLGKSGWYTSSNDGGATWKPGILINTGGQPFLAITGCALHAIWVDSGVVNYRRNPTGNCTATSSAEPLAAQVSNPAASLYPSPGGSRFILSYHLPHPDAVLQLYDVIGRLAYSHVVDGREGEVEIDVSFLGTGIYYWAVISEDSIVDQGKTFVIR